MSYSKLITLILSCLIGLAVTNCGYTILSTKSELANSTKNHPEYNFEGQWTKTNVNKYDGFSFVTYYLLLVSASDSSGKYGLGFDKNPNIYGDYFVSSNTLILVNEFNIQKFRYEFNGRFLELKTISIEQLDDKGFPLIAAGKWSRLY
jgi:hypothetical protein